MQYGLTIENNTLILDKAKTKKDGCYKFRGVAYRVRGGRVTHFANNGQILENYMGFNVIVGECSVFSDEAHKQLKAI
jgi:hypothetical protein